MTNYAEDKAYNFVMDVIYIDRLFFLNLILDYLLLLCSARVCGVRLRRKRYFLAALFGAGFAAASIFPALEFLLLTPVKIAAGALTLWNITPSHVDMLRTKRKSKNVIITITDYDKNPARDKKLIEIGRAHV